MARNKVIYGGETLIDLTADTVNANNTLQGVTGHSADGNSFTGTVAFVTYYTGTSDPSSSLGSNGDIYLKTVS